MAAEYRSIVDLTGPAPEDGFGVLEYMAASSAPSSWRVLGTFDKTLGFPERPGLQIGRHSAAEETTEEVIVIGC